MLTAAEYSKIKAVALDRENQETKRRNQNGNLFSNNAPKGVFAQYIQRTRFKKRAGSYLADDVFGLEQRDVSTAFAVQKTI